MLLRDPLVSLLTALLSLALFSATVLALLDDGELRRIPSPGDDFDIHTGKLLAPILIPRVPGTEGSVTTQRHFVDFFRTNLPEWQIIWQNSTSKTPATGDVDVPFSNLIIRRDPPGAQVGKLSRFTLVAHFDSKLQPTGFIGATDSAAPCAMLLHVARSIEGALKAKWAARGAEESATPEGVQILLLDGEEAFVSWSDTDSLYGARYPGPLPSRLNSAADTAGPDRWLLNGSRVTTLPCPSTNHRSIPSASLCCSTSWAPATLAFRPTS